MRKLLLLSFLISNTIQAYSQLVPCRPKMSMINYNLHDDNMPNADMNTIKSVKPDILIDNTPGGYWGMKNGHIGANPAEYKPLGIEVYSYITAGYEGTKYQNGTDHIDSNLVRVDSIANDKATGVFMDEVTSFPNANAKAYIERIYDSCQARGLKLILNVGVQSFDSWLMSHCDYIMTDEQYDGKRAPSSSEQPYLQRVLVVSENVATDVKAAEISLGARANGFGFSYACVQYTQIPPYISSYMAKATEAPPTPVISLIGSTLQSDIKNGNQWYEKTKGPIANETGQTFVNPPNGRYYSIITLQGCSSDTSNVLSVGFIPGGIEDKNSRVAIYPNPAKNYFTIELGSKAEVATMKVYNSIGALVRTEKINSQIQNVQVSNLPSGIYYLGIESGGQTEYKQIMIQN